MTEVVVRLTDDEQAALRHEFSEPYGHEIRVAIFGKLRAALDSPPVEVNETNEYRVLGEDGHAVRGFRELESAKEEKRRVDELGQGPHRIQSRRVSLGLSPWTDLPSEEGERG